MKIQDLFNIKKSITTSREYFKESGIPCVHYGDIYRYYNEKEIKSTNIINKFSLPVSKDKYINEDSIIMPDVTETISDYGHLTYIKYDGKEYINGTHTFAIIGKSNQNLKYLFYYLQSPKNIKRLQTLLLGSTVFQISLNDLKKYELDNYHNIEDQQHIVDIIGSIDDKIENNNKIITKLDNLMILNFKKIYNQALENSELNINLREYISLTTGKKDANASVENGQYPFFTCSEKNSQINEYSFNQEAILIAGNGNMSVKYYNGKFDAYQRTYVICPKKYFCYIYLFYKNHIRNIAQGARGSVIKFLTKSMLEDIELPILNEEEMFNFETINKIILSSIQKLENETLYLTKLKQSYLKKFFN